MNALTRYAAALLVGLALGGWVGWAVEGWRSAAAVATTKAEVAGEREAASDNARSAEAEQRTIEFNRLEANANVSYETRAALDAAVIAARDRDATIAGLRNVIAAADASARSGQASRDSGTRTGADDANILRAVVGECTTEYATLAEDAVRAGITVTGLQGYAQAIMRK